jgi:excisionase family DNA binding protein
LFFVRRSAGITRPRWHGVRHHELPSSVTLTGGIDVAGGCGRRRATIVSQTPSGPGGPSPGAAPLLPVIPVRRHPQDVVLAARSDSKKEIVMATWLRVPQAAQYAGVSRDTIYTACARNEIRHVRVGGRRAIRLKPEWIDEWFERCARGDVRRAGQTREAA